MIVASEVSVRADEVTLLAPVDLDVARGESVAVRGENGSGKTTLLRVIAGRLTPTSGTVTVGGLPVDDRDPGFRRRLAGAVGPVPFARDLTVREQLTLIASTWGLSVPEDAADTVIGRLGLSPLSERFPHEMSSGQRQLAGLAAVFVRPFEVLVLDEPEQRLDADRVATIIAELDRVRADGATVLIATHSDRIADAATDRSIHLDTA